jgi:hypothetical protein
VDPVKTPLFSTGSGKTYPQPNDPSRRYRSLEFEALERTFTLAGPLIHIDPDVSIRNIKLRDYYGLQLYNALTPATQIHYPCLKSYLMPPTSLHASLWFIQNLALAADVLCPLTLKQKDEMAVTISKWAHHRTTQNNWRIFNIVTLSFLKKHGYEIDDELLKNHLLWVASYHSGDGWYLEQTYNYYTISLFVVYGTIWNRAFGDEFYPEIATLSINLPMS